MDVLPRTIRQFLEIYRQMSFVQRAALNAILVTVLLGFGWLQFRNQPDDFKPLLFRQKPGPEQLLTAEQTLITAGLTNFRRNGQQLFAPVKELDRYNAALLQSDSMSADLGSQLLKQYETLGPFSTDRHRQQMKEALLLQELRQMIKSVPEIEDARVAIAASERRLGWNQRPRSTANVTIKPRSDAELSSTLINSIRLVVANMVPDLTPNDVTVFDVTNGQAYFGEPTNHTSERNYLQRSREFSRQYERRIQQALGHVSEVGVTVQVDLEVVKTSLTRRDQSDQDVDNHTEERQEAEGDDAKHLAAFRGAGDDIALTDREETLLAAIPGSIHVSITIPRDYIRAVVKSRHARGERSDDRLDPNLVEDEIVAKVERIVNSLIPADLPGNVVSVTCVDRLTMNSPAVATSQRDVVSQVMLHPELSAGMAILVAIGLLGMWLRTQQRIPAASKAVEKSESLDHSVVPVAAAGLQEPEEVVQVLPLTVATEVLPPASHAQPDHSQDSIVPQRGDDEVQAGPFAFLLHRHAEEIRSLIQDEYPQTIAVITSQLPPNLAAEVLSGLPADMQSAVVGRLARIGSTDLDVLAEIAALLQGRIGKPRIRSGGIPAATAVLRESSRSASHAILQSINQQDERLSQSLRRSLFTFNDIGLLDDATLQVILEETDQFPWSAALKGASESLRQRVLSVLPVAVAKRLHQELSEATPLRLVEITNVQHQISDAVFSLEMSGLIELPLNGMVHQDGGRGSNVSRLRTG